MAKIGMLSSMVNGKRLGSEPGNPVGTLGPLENTLGYPEFLKWPTRERPNPVLPVGKTCHRWEKKE